MVKLLCLVTLKEFLMFVLFSALADGALNPVLSLCAMKEDIALLALMTLSHIVEFHGNLAPLIEVCCTELPQFKSHIIYVILLLNLKTCL